MPVPKLKEIKKPDHKWEIKQLRDVVAKKLKQHPQLAKKAAQIIEEMLKQK